jgi:CubicO group peptidase (beta-lactamase class C family)
MIRHYITLIILGILLINPANSLSQHNLVKTSGLHDLEEMAIMSNSNSFIIEKNDERIVEYFRSSQELIETMSVTKLVVALGVGRMLKEGYINSIDQKVYTLYPEWKDGKKMDITIRHLLNHTSGLQNVADARVEIHPSKDVVRLALEADLESIPGARFSYNNKAVNLLAGIFEKAAGMKMDDYIGDSIFNKLGIEEYKWLRDQAGNPYAMSGLQLKAGDLAKIGRLVLNGGKWNGEIIITGNYLDEMLGKNSDHEFGLLWRKLPKNVVFTFPEERFHYLKEKGVSVHILEKLESYIGATKTNQHEVQQVMIEVFGTPAVFHKELVSRGIENLFIADVDGVAGYYGDGDLGQYLIVLPDRNMVVVRQIKYSESFVPGRDSFPQLLDMVLNLNSE